MKKVSIITMALIALIGFNACTDDDALVFTSQDPVEAITFVNSISSEYVLTSETLSNTAERFVWQTPDFGADTAVTYDIQGSGVSTFETFSSLGTTSENDIAVTVSQLFNLALTAGLDNDPETSQVDENGAPILDSEGNPIPNNKGELFFRLVASVGTTDDGPSTTSDILPLNVFLPEPTVEEEELPKFYLIGNFLEDSGYGANWTPSENLPFIASSGIGETSYEGFVNMQGTGIQYKFLPEETGTSSFEGDYGDVGDSEGSFSGILEQEGEVNCGLPAGETPGYFYVKADFSDVDNITYSLEKTNWAVTGNATPNGWPSDTADDHDLTYDPATKLWTITLDLTQQDAPDNGLKFRANDDWALNLGDNDADSSLEFSGTNISVPEDGTYLITLDLSNPRGYTYSLELQ